MTLDHTPVFRRKDLGPPDVLTLETDLMRQGSRRRVTGMTVVYVVTAALEGLVIGWPLGMIWLVALFSLLGGAYVACVHTFGGRWIARALQAETARNPRLNRYGNNLAVPAGIAPPEILIVRGDRPNAFAIGLKPYAVVATTGSLNIADLTLEGLMAHEVAHLRDGDAAVTSWFIGLTATTELLRRNTAAAPILALAVLLLPAALVVRWLRPAWFADGFESRADVAAALLTRYPPGVAVALRAAERATAPGPRSAAPFWFAPKDEKRALLIEEM